MAVSVADTFGVVVRAFLRDADGRSAHRIQLKKKIYTAEVMKRQTSQSLSYLRKKQFCFS